MATSFGFLCLFMSATSNRGGASSHAQAPSPTSPYRSLSVAVARHGRQAAGGPGPLGLSLSKTVPLKPHPAERGAVLCLQRDQRRYSAPTGCHTAKVGQLGTRCRARRTQPGERPACSREQPGLNSSFPGLSLSKAAFILPLPRCPTLFDKSACRPTSSASPLLATASRHADSPRRSEAKAGAEPRREP